MKESISFADFEKLDMRVGKIIQVDEVPRTQKLYKIRVDIKDKTIQIVSSLRDYYTPEDLQERLIIVLINLEPATFCGEVSEGMLLCAETEDSCILLTPEHPIEVGASIT
jgi:methionine--tRNA ligase beta chain